MQRVIIDVKVRFDSNANLAWKDIPIHVRFKLIDNVTVIRNEINLLMFAHERAVDQIREVSWSRSGSGQWHYIGR